MISDEAQEQSFSEIELYIKTTECGPNDCLSMAILFADLQEAADIGAVERGFSINVLEPYHACWIVMRTRVKVHRFPHWREKIRIRTWSTGVDKLYFGREYEVLDEQDDIIAAGTSMWILADLDTHRPLIPSRIEGICEMAKQNERHVFGENCERLRMDSRESIQIDPIISKYGDFSELDHNNHVNNTRYIAWTCDALGKASLNPEQIEDFSVNYINEVLPGERVDIFLKREDETILVFGYKQVNIPVFCTRIILKGNNLI